MNNLKKTVGVLIALGATTLLFQNCGDNTLNLDESGSFSANQIDSERVQLDLTQAEVSLNLNEGDSVVLTPTEESSYTFVVDLDKRDGDSTLTLSNGLIKSQSLELLDSGTYYLLKNNGTVLTLNLIVSETTAPVLTN